MVDLKNRKEDEVPRRMQVGSRLCVVNMYYKVIGVQIDLNFMVD